MDLCNNAFRRDNGKGIRYVCRRFVMLCRELKLFTDSVEDIAAKVGFGSVQVLRHHFRAKLGLAPRDYRARFGLV